MVWCFVAINFATISHEQKSRILQMQEGHFLDVKSIQIAPKSLTKTLSAFANTDGGELYIGISQDVTKSKNSWDGFANQEGANGHIQCIDEFFPLNNGCSYTFLQCSDELTIILQVSIQKTRDIKSASNDTPYVRRGAQNIPINTPEAMKRLELDKGITSYETSTVACELEVITNSIPIIKFMIDVIPSLEPIPWLKKQQLILNQKPTVGGILLFAEEPQAVLPKRCAIKVYRYRTKDILGSRDTLDFEPITVEGCLYDQIQDAVKTTVKVIENLVVLGVTGFEQAKYPFETLHEVITNAVLHRDYSITDDIHVRIFDNRIEVESPGKLAGHITVKNILRESFSRNPSIVRLIHKFPNPPNKEIGEGLNTAFQAMRKLNLKDPEVIENENSVLVMIRHEPLASNETIIMDYLKSHPEINNSKAREICFVGSETSMKKILQRMVSRNLIEPVPGRKGKAYAYQLTH